MKPRYSLLSFLGAVCALLGLWVTPQATAQSTYTPPGKLTYQGFLTDANGVPIGNTAPAITNVVFRIYTASTGGTLKWSSQQTVIIDKGHFSVLLGEGSQVGSEPFSADLSSVFTGSDASDRYLELTVNTTTISPRLQFLPSPYAMLAKNANQIVDQSGTAILTPYSGSIAINKSSAPVSTLEVNGTVTATAFSGSGASLTSLSASQLTTGTVPNARLDPNPTVSGTVTANTFVGNGTIPLGGIIMWSGTDATIPEGWALCNGQTSNGRTTPDLRNRFIVGGGTGGNYTTGNAGGNNTITLTVDQLPPHAHNVFDFYYSEHANDPASTFPGSGDSDNDNYPFSYYLYHTTEYTGGGYAVDIRPYYYALAFIMRVK